MEKAIIEFDQHTSSRPCRSAIERMNSCFLEGKIEVPPHVHPIYALVDAAKEDVFIFTSSGADAVGQVIWSVFSTASRKEGKTQFITSCIEDAPTLQMLKRCEELGCAAKIAPVDGEGKIDVEKLSAMITPRTALISVTMAQGLTGVIQPIEDICRLGKERGVLIHLDASYAIGKTYFSFSSLSADYLTFSGERIHSVKGSGALFAKKGRAIIPFILGGGSSDTPSLAALGAAASLAILSLDSMGLEAARLRDLFETEIQSRVADAQILFKNSQRLPNTAGILFPRVHAEALNYILQRKGLYANSGGAYCQHLHSILASSGIDGETALSFSLSRMTTEDEVIAAASIIGETVKSLKAVSEDLWN